MLILFDLWFAFNLVLFIVEQPYSNITLFVFMFTLTINIVWVFEFT